MIRAIVDRCPCGAPLPPQARLYCRSCSIIRHKTQETASGRRSLKGWQPEIVELQTATVLVRFTLWGKTA